MTGRQTNPNPTERDIERDINRLFGEESEPPNIASPSTDASSAPNSAPTPSGSTPSHFSSLNSPWDAPREASAEFPPESAPVSPSESAPPVVSSAETRPAASSETPPPAPPAESAPVSSDDEGRSPQLEPTVSPPERASTPEPSTSEVLDAFEDRPSRQADSPNLTDGNAQPTARVLSSFDESWQPGMQPTEPAPPSPVTTQADAASPPPPVESLVEPSSDPPLDQSASPAAASGEPSTAPTSQQFLQQLNQYQQQYGEDATQDLLSQALIDFERRYGVAAARELIQTMVGDLKALQGSAAAESLVSNLAPDPPMAQPEHGSPVAIAPYPISQGPPVQPPYAVHDMDDNLGNYGEPAVTVDPVLGPGVPPPPPPPQPDRLVPIPTGNDRQNLLNLLPLALVAAIAGTALAFTLLRRGQAPAAAAQLAIEGFSEVTQLVEQAIGDVDSPPTITPVNPDTGSDFDPNTGSPPTITPVNPDSGAASDSSSVPPPPDPNLNNNSSITDPSIPNPSISPPLVYPTPPPATPTPLPGAPLPGVQLW